MFNSMLKSFFFVMSICRIKKLLLPVGVILINVLTTIKYDRHTRVSFTLLTFDLIAYYSGQVDESYVEKLGASLSFG